MSRTRPPDLDGTRRSPPPPNSLPAREGDFQHLARARSGWLQRLRRWPIIPGAIVALITISAVFAPLIAPYSPTVGVLKERNLPPAWYEGGSSDHLLGTDPVGRDVLSRVIYGARISMMVAVIVLTVGAVTGTFLGLLSGWLGGSVDEVVMRAVDFTFAVPFILVALVVVVALGQSMGMLIVLLVVFSWSGFARQVRGETLQLRTLDYVAAAKTAGASGARIIIRHLLPGVADTVLVLMSLRVGTLILTEAALSYLGVGIPPPTAAWGLMVSEGRQYITTAWWVSFFPGLAIFFTVVAFNFLGDWVTDRWNPRLRQL